MTNHQSRHAQLGADKTNTALPFISTIRGALFLHAQALKKAARTTEDPN
jgi:hypothetical protein